MAKPNTPNKKPTDATEWNGETEGAVETRVPKFERKQRVYRGTQEFDHDLFKLLPAKLVRNNGYDDENPILVEIEHSHIFHTVDSNGKKQDACCPIGGHFHMVKIVGEKEGVPVLEISAPKKWVMKKVPGRGPKPVRVAADVFIGGEQDEHIHEYEYRGSERLKPRKTNMDALKFEGAVAAVHNPQVPGVIES